MGEKYLSMGVILVGVDGISLDLEMGLDELLTEHV
jgi:hypothetical protein